MPIPCSTIAEDEYADFYQAYVARLRAQCSDVLVHLAAQQERTAHLLAGVSEAKSHYRYAADKWSVRDVVGHLADAERIMGYRALWIARGGSAPLPGFDEQTFARTAGADDHPLGELAAELATVRTATLTLFGRLDDVALARRGVANGNPVTVRGLAAIIGGHELHHLAILEERYLNRH
jgi:hypothetical protein